MHPHHKLSLGAESLGYSELEEGMCLGVAYLFGILFAGRKEAYLHSLMALIEEYRTEEKKSVIKEAVESIREKVKQKESLTDHQVLLLDTAAFFDAIELLQNWNLHLDLFDAKPVANHFLKIYPLIKPKAFEDLEPIVFLNKDFIGDEEEIMDFFNTLSNSLSLTEISVSIIISHIEHVVFLQGKKDKWLFIDINFDNNGLHFLSFEQLLDTKALCKHLFKSFEVEGSEYLAFSSLLFGFVDDTQFIENLAKFNLKYDPTPEKALLDDSSGASLLYFAAYKGDVVMVKYLIENGAKIDATSAPDNITPLIIAILNGYPEMVKYLTAAGANVNITTNSGISPLSAAIEMNSIECVEILLKHNTNPNLTLENLEFIPLHKACLLGNTAIVQLLINFGADITLMDQKNGRAFDLALYYKFYDIAELILDKANQMQLEPLSIMAINTLPKAKTYFAGSKYQPYLQGRQSLLNQRSRLIFHEQSSFSQEDEPLAKKPK